MCLRCHSFDYGDTGDRVCRLSHHTSTSLSHVRDPFLVIADVKGTFELSSCYNVTIDCRSSEMVATITTNKIFSGKIYAKDNPNSCVVDVENDIQFSISMTYNDIGCDVKREELGVYTNQVSSTFVCHRVFLPVIPPLRVGLGYVMILS